MDSAKNLPFLKLDTYTIVDQEKTNFLGVKSDIVLKKGEAVGFKTVNDSECEFKLLKITIGLIAIC